MSTATPARGSTTRSQNTPHNLAAQVAAISRTSFRAWTSPGMREPSWDAVGSPVGPHGSLPPIVLRPAASSAARLNASCASLWIAPVTLRALTAAPVTPLVGTNNTANQHCAVGFEPLPRDLKTRLSTSSRQNVAGPGRAKATSGTSGPPRWTTSEPPSSGDPDLRTGNDASPPTTPSITTSHYTLGS